MATRQQGISVSVPAGGELLTVMYPREKGEPAPKIKPLPGQVGLEITSQAGTDYVFLSRQRAAVKHQQIEFDGHAGIVQIRGQAVHVTLIGPGMLRYGDVVAEQGDAAVDEMNQASSGQRFDFLKRWPGVHASNE